MDWFSDRDILLGLESKLSRDTLESNIKKFRVSWDFSIAKDTIVKPKDLNIVKVKLEKSLFPEMEYITPWMLKHLEISMRSCFAQSWIHIVGKFFDYINVENIEELNTKWSTDLDVYVLNRWLSDVQLKDWWAFFRLYFRPSGQSITGNALYEIVKSWKLKVEWAYGKTWSLVWANMPAPNQKVTWKMLDTLYEAKELKENESSEALTLKLHLNNNIYIPDNKKWMLIESKKNLIDILQPFDEKNPRHIEHDFNIGETFYVDFWEYFWAIIYQWYDGWWHHIISPLIDPWFKWPIRTEIVKWDGFNDFIELHIYHKDGK